MKILGIVLVLGFICCKDYQQRKTYNGVPIDDPEVNEPPMTEEERQDSLNKFYDEWGRLMVDFNPGQFYTFQIDAGRSRRSYEDITFTPALFRGAFSASSEDASKLSIKVYAPNGNIIFTTKRERKSVV